MAENEKSIKVSDFRMFTPDGRLKPEFQDLENAPAPSPASAGKPPAKEPGPPEPPPARPEPAEGGIEPDFADLVRLLATNAYAAMGLLSEPGRKPPADLDAARRMIDWLSVLERKTRNNLSFAEQDLLSRILYELRMAYVEATAPTGPAAR